MYDDMINDSDLNIALGESGIFIEGNHLIKKEKNGTITAKYPLSSIRQVSYNRKIDSAAFVMLLIGAASIYFPSQYLTNELLKWVFYVVAVILIAIFILGLKKNLVVVELNNDSVEYPCSEESPVVKGFVLSLQEILRNLSK